MSSPTRNDDLPVFVRWSDFLKWLLPATEKFPKRVRFTFSNRIDNLALDVVEDLVEARYTKRKTERLKAINLKLERLRVLLRLCHDLHYLPHQSYEHASRSLAEVGRMVGGWIREQESR
ncbi:MAG: diversity-generating retroelement protein Avd [Candidatus Latescibacteria bacterium]|jgi:hypothetical protein|nr:diversity-generating retroelement protein Avd [Candidatus Latescibacterota bacterium]